MNFDNFNMMADLQSRRNMLEDKMRLTREEMGYVLRTWRKHYPLFPWFGRGRAYLRMKASYLIATKRYLSAMQKALEETEAQIMALHAVSKNAPKLNAHELPKAIELIARLS